MSDEDNLEYILSERINHTQKAYFTKDSTMALIEVYKIHEERMNDNKMSAHFSWNQIRNEMTALGYSYSETQLKDRFNYLKRIWKKKREDNNRTGSETTPNPFFFEEMESLFGKKPNIQPLSECSTSSGFKTFTGRGLTPAKSKRTSKDSEDSEVSPRTISKPRRKRKRENSDDEYLKAHRETSKGILNALNRLIDKMCLFHHSR